MSRTVHTGDGGSSHSAPPRRAPVLFLDVDGVLLPPASDRRMEKARESLDQLHRVVETTGCEIVLSSMWRLILGAGGVGVVDHNRAEQLMRKRFGYDGPSFIGATPDLKGEPRGLEIAAWLASQAEAPPCWAVVDDDPDMPFVRHRFVQTNPRIGLDEVAADRLIELLTDEHAGLLESSSGGEGS